MVVCSTGECAVEPVSRDVRHARQHFTVLYISVLCCHNWFIHNYLKPVCGENSYFYTNVIWSIIQFDGPLHVLSWFGRKGDGGLPTFVYSALPFRAFPVSHKQRHKIAYRQLKLMYFRNSNQSASCMLSACTLLDGTSIPAPKSWESTPVDPILIY